VAAWPYARVEGDAHTAKPKVQIQMRRAVLSRALQHASLVMPVTVFTFVMRASL
jgi:hypothetical protein